MKENTRSYPSQLKDRMNSKALVMTLRVINGIRHKVSNNIRIFQNISKVYREGRKERQGSSEDGSLFCGLDVIFEHHLMLIA